MHRTGRRTSSGPRWCARPSHATRGAATATRSHTACTSCWRWIWPRPSGTQCCDASSRNVGQVCLGSTRINRHVVHFRGPVTELSGWWHIVTMPLMCPRFLNMLRPCCNDTALRTIGMRCRTPECKSTSQFSLRFLHAGHRRHCACAHRQNLKLRAPYKHAQKSVARFEPCTLTCKRSHMYRQMLQTILNRPAIQGLSLASSPFTPGRATLSR